MTIPHDKIVGILEIAGTPLTSEQTAVHKAACEFLEACAPQEPSGDVPLIWLGVDFAAGEDMTATAWVLRNVPQPTIGDVIVSKARQCGVTEMIRQCILAQCQAGQSARIQDSGQATANQGAVSGNPDALELISAQAQAQDNAEQLADARAQLWAARAALRMERADRERAKAVIGDLRAQLAEGKQTCESLRQQLGKSELKATDLQLQNAALRKLNPLLQQAMAISEDCAPIAGQAAENDAALLRAEVERLQEQLANVMGQRDAAVLERDQLRGERDAARNLCTEANAARDAAIQLHNQVKERETALRQQADAAISELQIARKLVTEGDGIIRALRQERDAIVASCRELRDKGRREDLDRRDLDSMLHAQIADLKRRLREAEALATAFQWRELTADAEADADPANAWQAHAAVKLRESATSADPELWRNAMAEAGQRYTRVRGQALLGQSNNAFDVTWSQA